MAAFLLISFHDAAGRLLSGHNSRASSTMYCGMNQPFGYSTQGHSDSMASGHMRNESKKSKNSLEIKIIFENKIALWGKAENGKWHKGKFF